MTGFPPGSLSGQTALITGASSGIGRVAARALARLGATVVLLCRNAAAGEAVCREIERESGRNAADLLVADLASLTQVRQAAAEFCRRQGALHILINNAGLLMGRRTLTEDGYETTFAVNHLAHFLLTRLLLERLRSSAPARVINVSSMVHRWTGMDFDNLQGEKSYRPLRAYAQSKLANILFTYRLAEWLKGTGVTANCLHPGLVATNFGRQGPAWYRLVKPLARALLYITPEQGADTLIHLAAAPEVAEVSGRYFVKRRPVATSRATRDRALQDRLWTESERLVNLEASF